MIGVKRSGTVPAVPDHVAVLCDIHGNAPALEAVLAELRADPPDAVVIGGDVAAGPMPNEVLAALRALPWPVHFLRGNADRVLVMAYDGEAPEYIRAHPLWASDRWTAARLPREDRDWLTTLPPLVRLEVGALGEVLFCHGTPRSDEERVTVFTPQPRLAAVLATAGAPLVVCRHTPPQFDPSAGGGAGRLLRRGAVAPAEEDGVDEEREDLEERHARLVPVGEREHLLVNGEEPRVGRAEEAQHREVQLAMAAVR